MYLIIGLGNPGSEYRNHRHNVGFMALDAIAARHNYPPFKKKYKGLFADGKIDGQRTLLLKPQTYMNRSGEAVAAIANFYKIPVENIIVLYDELDLAPGKLRNKTGGGNGGHNGLRSIDPAIGKDYRRVRIGIGHPGHKDRVTSHVLGNFSKKDGDWLNPMLDAIGENAEMLIKGEDARFMNKIALAVFGDVSTKKKTPEPKKSQPKVSAAEEDNSQTDSSGPMASMLKKLFTRD